MPKILRLFFEADVRQFDYTEEVVADIARQPVVWLILHMYDELLRLGIEVLSNARQVNDSDGPSQLFLAEVVDTHVGDYELPFLRTHNAGILVEIANLCTQH